MRIASYNLFEGAQDTLPLLEQFVKEQGIDVLCVQEANGWNDGNPPRLKTLAAHTGLDAYAYGDSNTRFKLATLSRIPILQSQVYTKGFWHCAVRTTVPYGDGTLDLWNSHLNPGGEVGRLSEAKLVTSMIDMDKPTLIMGDLNSLSKADKYPDDLICNLASKGIEKFGTDKLRYDVTDYLAHHGLIDIAAERGARQPTVPTPANKDMFHAASMRLDYMFATASLAKCVTDITAPKDSLTDAISDHYPIILTLADPI